MIAIKKATDGRILPSYFSFYLESNMNWKYCQGSVIQLFRRMSSTHMEKTKHVIRNPKIFSTATISKIASISPTVKHLTVNVDSKELIFKPGQWVDFIVPGLSTVGGFSMCSTPSLLKNENMLDLAVKYSTHPPAHWVHNECIAGSRVALQVGGDFSYELTRTNVADNILLIAAGVGINPLLSMMKQIFDFHRSNLDCTTLFGKIALCYTATTFDELIFKEDISTMASNDKTFDVKYFVTRQSADMLPENVIPRRMSKADLLEIVNDMHVLPHEVISYLCAPPEMMSEIEEILKDIGLRKENIRYESWW